MKDQHTAGPAEIEQNNIHRPLSHTTTVSSSNSSRSDNAAETPRQSSHKRSFPSGARLFRSRSKSPAAIETELRVNRTRRSTYDSCEDTIPRSVPTSRDSIPRRSTSPTAMSPIETTSPTSAGPHKRDSGSYSSHSRKSGDDYRRYSGTVNHYGRHSNDWLFGGFSLRDTVREGVDRLRHHGKES
ncbi:uncharacterized protein CDV56_103590 [Aspergillus thermomutatus]|uniref:Uncharacterized protein n=1 Tax=Aspergillus thermomutatus TaxID=41047 RepID=A0A397GB74_ASPTH|nr:uncharacterized protein CDV56_103590 [Aspergillus thermomutatus]RHZ45350.1 hypothetical protein CDV56_103590 [Aspergillus thermomutatus]